MRCLVLCVSVAVFVAMIPTGIIVTKNVTNNQKVNCMYDSEITTQ